MSILKDLEKVGKDIEHDVEQIGAEIDKDLQKAIDAVGTGLAKAKALLEQGFDDVEQALIQKAIDDAKKTYGDTISKLRTLAGQGITSADPQSIVNDIIAAFKDASGDDANAVLSNLTTSKMRASFSDFTDFSTLTLYSDAEIDLGFGVAAAVGGGVRMTNLDLSESRMLMDFDASGGAEEGADAGLALGLWKDKPQDLQGGFIAATLGADEGVGANVIFYLSMTFPPDFIGVVLDLTAGEEIGASIDCGFTLSFKVPEGAGVQVT